MMTCFRRTIFVFSMLCVCCSAALAQSSRRADLLKEIESLRSQLKTREEAFLAPSERDRAAYAEFLRQPNTGLIRLLPREEFDYKHKLTIRGGGAYYSFNRLTHEYGYGSDIGLEMNYLSVGFAGADIGIIARLESASLDELTADSPVIQYLSTYQPPSAEPEARAEYRRLSEGVEEDNVVYRHRAPLEVGAAYILRSIDYGNSDVLVGIYIVRKDVDGSAIIAWKLLKKYPVPQLKREPQAAG